MIVVDASAAIELVLKTARASKIADRLIQTLHAPHLIDIEVMQALRRLTLAGKVGRERAEQAMDYLGSLAIRRHSHGPLLRRIWHLRACISVYDASYVALAEALGAPLLTCDEKLERAHGHTARIELIPATH